MDATEIETHTPIRLPYAARTALDVASKEKTTYALDAVEIQRKDGRSSLTATDGRSLAHVVWEDEGNDIASFLISAKTLSDFTESKADIFINRKESVIALKPLRGKSKVQAFVEIDGHFPPWRDVVPSKKGTARIVVSVTYLEIASGILGENGVKVERDENELKLTSSYPETTGSEVGHKGANGACARLTLALPCASFEPFESFAVNFGLLYRAALAVSTDRVTLEFISPTDAIVVKPGDTTSALMDLTSTRETFALVMPIRLD